MTTQRAMIVVAAGGSGRFESDKMMTDIEGRPLVAHTVDRVSRHVDVCILVCREDQLDSLSSMGLEADVVPGASTRTASEMSGLAALGGDMDLIGIHDGARPLVSGSLIEELFETARATGGAVPVVPGSSPVIERETLRPVAVSRAQTPQVFRGRELLAAYERAARAEFEGHDTAEIVQEFSELQIAAVPGDPENIKLTYPTDLEVVIKAIGDASRT